MIFLYFDDARFLTISTFCIKMCVYNGTPQCLYNIDALSAIHYDASRAYLEGSIRLLEIAKQDIRSYVSRATPWGFRRPMPLIWILITLDPSQGVTSHPEYILEKSMRVRACVRAFLRVCVCARAKIRTHLRTWSRNQNAEGFAERMTHLSEIFYSLHWFRIAFIYRILKLELLPLLPSSSHTLREGIECQGESTRSVKRTMRVTPPQTAPYSL